MLQNSPEEEEHTSPAVFGLTKYSRARLDGTIPPCWFGPLYVPTSTGNCAVYVHPESLFLPLIGVGLQVLESFQFEAFPCWFQEIPSLHLLT